MSWRDRLTWLFGLAALGLFMAMRLGPVDKIETQTGQTIFEARFPPYSQEVAREFLRALSDESRAAYLDVLHPIDMVFAPLLGITLVLLVWRFLPRRWAIGLTVVAALGAWCDYEEIVAIADLINLGPDGIDEELVSIASGLTTVKWISYAIVFLGIGVGVAIWFRERKA